MTDLQASRDWLYSLLTSNNTLLGQLSSSQPNIPYAVYSNMAPDNSNYPYIVYQYIPGVPDTTTMGGAYLVEAAHVWLVKVVTDGPSETLGFSLYDLMHNTLQNATSANFNGYLMNCVRQSSFMNMPINTGHQYRQIGGYYEIFVRPQNL